MRVRSINVLTVWAVVLATHFAQGPAAAQNAATDQNAVTGQNAVTEQGTISDQLTTQCEKHPAAGKKYKIAGLHVAVWQPLGEGNAPLVIFSHGSGGKNTKSKFLTSALARAGYLVVAPNHKDATLSGISLRPDFTFQRASRWNDKMYESRRQDIVNLLQALHADPDWDKQIDWDKVALSGHSLGGYTALGLGGAWPSWKIGGIKAILGLAPYCAPFVDHGDLGNISVPVMYQDASKDKAITASVKGPDGAFSKTPPPAYFVEFDHCGHLVWTDFNHNKKKHALINYYSIAFLDKYVKGIAEAKLKNKLDGVSTLEEK